MSNKHYAVFGVYISMILKLFPFIVLIFIVSACNKEDISDTGGLPVSPGWLIPEEDVKGDFRPRELVENPEYMTVDEMIKLDSASMVLVYKTAGGVYVYPHTSMVVEVVNDHLDGIPFAITYCPKTFSGICWDRTDNADTLQFVVSGYLYHDNLMPYELNSESIWSQMLNTGVRGSHKSLEVKTYQLIETTWFHVHTYFPEAHVFDFEFKSGPSNNGGSRVGPLAGGLLKSSAMDDLPLGKQVFGIQGLKGIEIFLYSHFPDSVRLINITVATQQLVVAGSTDLGFIVAFERDYVMTPVQGSFPVIMEDESGSRWNIFGEAVSGPRKGERMASPTSYFARGWAMQAIFQDELRVYGD